MQDDEGWLNDGEGRFRYTSTPPEGRFPQQNGSHITFETPKVPVIFVLGGPGSGKVTHCDTLMTEKRGVVHINMTDLLQQYTIGNADMKDFNQLSSKTVAEVLMLEMKMAPAAEAYLVSGYPRNMRDVVEYSNKIQRLSGVVLVAWREKVLERQIDYGAKLGHVVLSLAKMELANFFKNVVPVADYYDQRGMLLAINGERHPSEVYSDFRLSLMRFLGGREISTVVEIEDEEPHEQLVPNGVTPHPPTTAASVYKPPKDHQPQVIWVIGGPGSNKWSLCQSAVRRGWAHVSVGRLLRAAADDAADVKKALVAGDLVQQEAVMQLLEGQMAAHSRAEGILIDGFPRDVDQVQAFEDKFNQKPQLILLDCSKLQLGRGRLDDSIAAFRRRLELFRERTLPMLKSLDTEDRLNIVDGDTDSPLVREEFSQTTMKLMDRFQQSDDPHEMDTAPALPNGHLPNHGHSDTTVHDLEVDDEPVGVHHHTNGYGPAGRISDVTGTTAERISDVTGTMEEYRKSAERNGGLFGGPMLHRQNQQKPLPTRLPRPTRTVYAQPDRFPMDSNM